MIQLLALLAGCWLFQERTGLLASCWTTSPPSLTMSLQNIQKALGRSQRFVLGHGFVQALVHSICQYCDPAYGNSIWRKGTERFHECKTPPCVTLYGMIECPLTEMQQICYQWANMKWKQFVGCWLAVQSKRFLLQENLSIPLGESSIPGGGLPM